MEPDEDTSDAMHFEDFLAEQNAAGNEIDDEDIEQFGDVVNSSVLDVLQSGTTEAATIDDDVTFISKDRFGSMIEPSYLEAQNMKTEHLEDDYNNEAMCSACNDIATGSAVQCENTVNCVSERGWFHTACVDFDQWQDELSKGVEKDLKIKKKKKDIEKLNKVDRFINDCKMEYLNEDNKSTIFEQYYWDWKTKYPYFCPRNSSNHLLYFEYSHHLCDILCSIVCKELIKVVA